MNKRPPDAPEESDAALVRQAKDDARVQVRRAQVSEAQRSAEVRSYEKRRAALEDEEIVPEVPPVDQPPSADAPSTVLVCQEELELAPAEGTRSTMRLRRRLLRALSRQLTPLRGI